MPSSIINKMGTTRANSTAAEPRSPRCLAPRPGVRAMPVPFIGPRPGLTSRVIRKQFAAQVQPRHLRSHPCPNATIGQSNHCRGSPEGPCADPPRHCPQDRVTPPPSDHRCRHRKDHGAGRVMDLGGRADRSARLSTPDQGIDVEPPQNRNNSPPCNRRHTEPRSPAWASPTRKVPDAGPGRFRPGLSRTERRTPRRPPPGFGCRLSLYPWMDNRSSGGSK